MILPVFHSYLYLKIWNKPNLGFFATKSYKNEWKSRKKEIYASVWRAHYPSTSQNMQLTIFFMSRPGFEPGSAGKKHDLFSDPHSNRSRNFFENFGGCRNDSFVVKLSKLWRFNNIFARQDCSKHFAVEHCHNCAQELAEVWRLNNLFLDKFVPTILL